MKFNKEIPSAFSSTIRGINTEQKVYANQYGVKRKPRNFYQLARYPINSPICIGADWQSVACLQRFHGVCLLCDSDCEMYDFSFCYQREIWVFYANSKKLSAAMQLARAIQLAGATATLVMLLSNQLVRRNAYVTG